MESESISPRSNLLWWMFAVVWFGGWHLWHTWAVWLDPLNRVPGPLGDNMVMLWNQGWVKHALGLGTPGFWFTNAYYPDGFLFLYGTHTWLDGVLGWLFSPFMPEGYHGSIFWANITLAGATISSGLLVISGLKAWGVKVWPVLLLVASSVVFSWFRMFALTGHYHFYGTQWMLASITLVSYGKSSCRSGSFTRSRWFFALAGCAMGVTFLNDQTMAVFAGILCGVVLCALGNGTVQKGFSLILKSASWCYGFALLLASVHLVPILRAAMTGRLTYSAKAEASRNVDATSLVIPPDMHFMGSMVEPYRKAHGLFWAEGTYLGIIPMVFLIIGLYTAFRYLLTPKGNDDPALRSRRAIFYAMLCAGMFLLLSLGDTLIIGRQSYAALPGRMLKWMPLLNDIRLPQRWIWPALLCIALGGALTLQLLLSSKPRRQFSATVLALAMVPPLEGQSYPRVPPVDFKNDPFVNPTTLVTAVKKSYISGGVLLMPVEAAYAHGNIFQFLWGYDIPLTISYTARMPFSPQDVPGSDGRWTLKAGEWLLGKKVSIIIFPFHDAGVSEYQSWLREARTINPSIMAFNSSGDEI